MVTNKFKQARSRAFKKFLANARQEFPNLKFDTLKKYEAFKWVYYQGYDDGFSGKAGSSDV